MSKQLYASKDSDGWYRIWERKPKWNKKYESFLRSTGSIGCFEKDEFEFFFPQFKKIQPGQLAKVKRKMECGIAIFVLGKIIEEHGE